MDWLTHSLNYNHLHYFWLVVREGSVAKAASKLRLARPTVSEQIHTLEKTLGEKLFVKRGRNLELTEMGVLVHGFADEIFSIGRELIETVKGRPTGRPQRLMVGVAEVVPKLVAKSLLDPARSMSERVHIVCREDKTERLVASLASHDLDVVISDSPLAAGSAVRAFNHLLGECGITIFARKDLAARYKRGFPGSLAGAPMLLPTESTILRRSLDQWFDDRGVRPVVEAEFDDNALLKAFGQDGAGLFAAPTVIEREIERQYQVVIVGRVPEVRERFYAISPERRVRHPAVLAICEAAREGLFGATPTRRAG